MQNDPSPSFSISNIEGLIRRLESLTDPEARTTAAELIGMVLSFHHLALEHIVKELSHAEFGPQFIKQIVHNPLVNNLLLLHGFHPLPIEARVRAGLEGVEPYWKSAGYEVKRMEITDANLSIEFRKLGVGGRTAPALRSLVENVVFNAAPEIEGLTIEGLEESQPTTRGGFVPLSKLLSNLETSRAKSSGNGKQHWQ
jgi:hypothetical protein